MAEPPNGAADTPPNAFTIRNFASIRSDLAAAPNLPRYSTAQRRLLVMRSVVVALQVTTLILVLAGKHYSGPKVAVLVMILILVLAVIEGSVVAALVASTRRRVRANGDPSRRWQWQDCLFLGPYDDETGIPGSEAMYTVYERRHRSPVVTLMLVDRGFGWTSSAFMTATGGRSLVSRLATIDHVDLIAGSAPTNWWTAMHPRDGWRAGQVRIVTKDGRQALFSGVRLDHLLDRLQACGGQIRDSSTGTRGSQSVD